MTGSTRTDCIVVGASFAGLACATAPARAGHAVTVVEKKADAGEKLHTTGIIVKDAIDPSPLLDGLPEALTRRIHGVRLYAPNMRHVDLAAPGYYFLATDTPEVMRWLAARAVAAGARIECRRSFDTAVAIPEGFDLGELGTTRYLVGADGPHSTVARRLGLGQNERFLFGIEHEYAGVDITESDKLHCFVDRRIAPGYIGWAMCGVGILQVGLARSATAQNMTANEAMAAFVAKLAPLFDLRGVGPATVRAGMIPCGGIVRPVAARRALLVGDAAGMVSPLTAGGIHTALTHGYAVRRAIAEHFAGRRPIPPPGSWRRIRGSGPSALCATCSTTSRVMRSSISVWARS